MAPRENVGEVGPDRVAEQAGVQGDQLAWSDPEGHVEEHLAGRDLLQDGNRLEGQRAVSTSTLALDSWVSWPHSRAG